jgi:hypothetical protein
METEVFSVRRMQPTELMHEFQKDEDYEEWIQHQRQHEDEDYEEWIQHKRQQDDKEHEKWIQHQHQQDDVEPSTFGGVWSKWDDTYFQEDNDDTVSVASTISDQPYRKN